VGLKKLTKPLPPPVLIAAMVPSFFCVGER
jgi:hypothetical protein